MTKTDEIIKEMEKFASPEIAQSWDNSGWQIFFGKRRNKKNNAMFNSYARCYFTGNQSGM